MNYKPLRKTTNLFEPETSKSPDIISLYDILSFYRKLTEEQEGIIIKYENLMKMKLQQTLKNYQCVAIHPFDFNLNELFISLGELDYKNFEKTAFSGYCFKKSGDNLYLSEIKDRINYNPKYFPIIANEIEELYDFFYELGKIRKDNITTPIKSVNSNFYVSSMSFYSITISINCNQFNKKQMDIAYFSYKDEPNVENWDFSILPISENDIQTAEFLKNIYIKIEDCPKVIRASLYELRAKQLQKQAKDTMNVNSTSNRTINQEKDIKKKILFKNDQN